MKGGTSMENKFIRVDEVANELGVSKPYAYKLIRQLNEELKDKGFITIAGRVNHQFFNERLYGARKEVNENAGTWGCSTGSRRKTAFSLLRKATSTMRWTEGRKRQG